MLFCLFLFGSSDSLRNMATFTKHCYLRIESYFFIFQNPIIALKSVSKVRSKNNFKKIHIKWPPADHFWTSKWLELRVEASKNHPKLKKILFF